MAKYSFDYDAKNDDLIIFQEGKQSKGGIEVGDLIIDFDSKGNAIAIEFQNASKTLTEIQPERITKKLLSSMLKAKIQTDTKGDFLRIAYALLFAEKEVSSTIAIPNIVRPSPVSA